MSLQFQLQAKMSLEENAEPKEEQRSWKESKDCWKV